MSYNNRRFFTDESVEEKTRKYTRPHPIVTSHLRNLRQSQYASPAWTSPSIRGFRATNTIPALMQQPFLLSSPIPAPRLIAYPSVSLNGTYSNISPQPAQHVRMFLFSFMKLFILKFWSNSWLHSFIIFHNFFFKMIISLVINKYKDFSKITWRDPDIKNDIEFEVPLNQPSRTLCSHLVFFMKR